MATVNLELPADLVSAAKLDRGNVSQEAAKLIALELFREGTVSLGRAAELCATPLAAFMDFAAAHGVPPLNYGSEQLEEDRRTLAKIRS
jgi:predicted HTH domain antitoxin